MHMIQRLITYSWLLLRTIFCYCCAAIVGLLFFVPCLVVAACSTTENLLQNKRFFWLLDKMYRATIASFFLPIRMRGLEHMQAGPAIVVANHESSLDIPVLGIVMQGRPHLWYAWVRFFSTPVLGFLLRRMAMPVDCDHSMRAARSMIRGMALAEQLSLYSVLFPEGGRYNSGKVNTFFAGFGILAKKLKQPVIPVMLKNLGATYPPKSFLIYPHTIEVVVGEPMRPSEHETDEAFVERVRNWFLQQ